MNSQDNARLLLNVEEARLLRFELADHLKLIEEELMGVELEDAAISALGKMPSIQEVDLSGDEIFPVELTPEELKVSQKSVTDALEAIDAGVLEARYGDPLRRLLGTLRAAQR